MAAWSSLYNLMVAQQEQRPFSWATVRRILAFARPHRVMLAWFMVTSVLLAVLAVATPLLAGRAVDAIIKGRSYAEVLTIALVIAAIAVVEAGVGLLSRWLSASIGEGLILDLRRVVFEHVQRMPIAFFTRTRTGALVSRLNNDVIGAQRAFSDTLSGVVGNIVALALTLAAMLALSWQITLLALLLLPVFVLPARRFGRRLASLELEAANHNSVMSTQMTERFSAPGATLVKLFAMPTREVDEFVARATRVRDIGVRTAMVQVLFVTALTLVSALALALVYGLGGWFALQGTLEAGEVVALALLLTRLYAPLTGLASARVEVMSALVSFERVFEVLDLEPLIRERPDPADVPPGPVSVELEDVHFAYPSADKVSLASLEEVATLDTPWMTSTPPRVSRSSTGCRSAPSPARSSRWSARRAPASRRWRSCSRGCTTSTRAPYGSAASTCATCPSRRSAGRSAWSPRTVTCSTTRSARTCCSPGPARTTRSCGRRSPAHGSPTWSGRCPTGSTRSWASAATGCRAVSGSG